jgi:hypothetical protein
MPFEIHFGHMRVAEMFNYKMEVLKGITKRNALAGTNQQLLVETLMLFDYFEVNFLSYEGSENGNYKRLVLKAITKRNALAGQK